MKHKKAYQIMLFTYEVTYYISDYKKNVASEKIKDFILKYIYKELQINFIQKEKIIKFITGFFKKQNILFGKEEIFYQLHKLTLRYQFIYTGFFYID